MAERAEPAQHDTDKRTHQSAVALGERSKAGTVGRGSIEQFIKCAMFAQHAVDHAGGDAPYREAGNIGVGRLCRGGHSNPLQCGHGYAKSGAMPTDSAPPQKPPLTPAAERALAEAEARRADRARHAGQSLVDPKEVNGPSGPEPTRYGDWEKDGIASDF